MTWLALLAKVPARAWVLMALVAGAVFVAALIFREGGESVRKTIERRDAGDRLAASEANRRTAGAVADAASELGQATTDYVKEAGDARRDTERQRHVPPPAGYVGAEALVDPALAGPLLCRIWRVRDDASPAPSAECAAADRADRPAARP